MGKQPGAKGARKSAAGPSLEDLFETFPDDQAAKKWLESNIWPGGRRCPRCGFKHARVAKHPEMPYRCSECKKYFSARIGTVTERSQIGCRKWAAAAYLLATRPKGISGVRLHRDLGISQGAAWLLLHKLGEACRALAEPDPMAGPVGAD